jgi:CoA:oxalate CoA-transferase
MHDPHMHERRMLEWIEHDEIADPRRDLAIAFHGADGVATAPSHKLGQHNADIYGGWLGLPPGEIADLTKSGAI